MSQTNVLSAAQTQAHAGAVHKFIGNASKIYGAGSVILVPKFVEQADGTWLPENVNTPVRKTNDSMFLRFGRQYMKQTAKGSEIAYMFSNKFGDTADDLEAFLAYVAPTATIGSAVRNARIVIHESLIPFTKVDPDKTMKRAGVNGKALVKYVTDYVTGETTAKPIYQTTKLFFPNEEGLFPKKTPVLFRVVENKATGICSVVSPDGRKVREDDFLNETELKYNDQQIEKCAMETAEDRFIAHDNGEELSDDAVARIRESRRAADDNKARTAALQNRIAELQGKATLTAAEELELKALVPASSDEAPF